MRIMHNYFRIGGVAVDLPYGWIDKCLYFFDYFFNQLNNSFFITKKITKNFIEV